MFFRRDVIVAVAPHLYGQAPGLVEALVDRPWPTPSTVPLVGVPGARERPYSLASVVAREAAIAEGLARQLDRSDAPAVPLRLAWKQAVRPSKQVGAAAVSPGSRRQAVDAICTSGRGAELVVGVAGAGKTTMLRAVAAAFARRRLPGGRTPPPRARPPAPSARKPTSPSPAPWPV